MLRWDLLLEWLWYTLCLPTHSPYFFICGYWFSHVVKNYILFGKFRCWKQNVIFVVPPPPLFLFFKLNNAGSHLALSDQRNQCFRDSMFSLDMSVKGTPPCPFPIWEWVSTTWKAQDTEVPSDDSQSQVVITTPANTSNNWKCPLCCWNGVTAWAVKSFHSRWERWQFIGSCNASLPPFYFCNNTNWRLKHDLKQTCACLHSTWACCQKSFTIT